MPALLNLAQAVLTLVIFGGLVSLLPVESPIVEISRNFALYHLVACALGFVVLLLFRTRWSRRFYRYAAVALMLIFLATVRPILPFYLPAANPLPRENEGKLRVLYANVETDGGDPKQFLANVREYNPDIIGLIEVGSRWKEGFALPAAYAHAHEVIREDNFGLGLYSKYPLTLQDTGFFERDLPPLMMAQAELPGGSRVSLTLLHSFPPLSTLALRRNTLLLRRASIILRHVEGPVIVMADLNATPASPFYGRLANNAELADVFLGRGWQATWNAKKPWFRVPIDHVMYKGGVRLIDAKVLPAFGSDHYAILSEFGL